VITGHSRHGGRGIVEEGVEGRASNDLGDDTKIIAVEDGAETGKHADEELVCCISLPDESLELKSIVYLIPSWRNCHIRWLGGSM